MCKKTGIVEIGGGVPKNTAQQTGPLLDQILGLVHGGQNYIIQITDARSKAVTIFKRIVDV